MVIFVALYAQSVQLGGSRKPLKFEETQESFFGT